MPDRQKRILILGYGAMGTMFEQLLGPHHEVTVWVRDPETGEENDAVENLAADREIVLFALPTHPHRELATRVSKSLPDGAVCLSIAKGLDEHGQTSAQIFERILPDRLHWGMIYGPMIARDLKRGKTGFAVLAGDNEQARRTALLFSDTLLHLDVDDDTHGTAWAVVLKNIFVPLIGAADALDLGDNMRGFLMTEAVGELERIIAEMGGKPQTARGPSGLGDLIASATSESSHHRSIGADLAAGKDEKVAAGGDYIRSEGVHTARQVREHGLVTRGRHRLFDLSCDFLTGSNGLEDMLDNFLRERFGRGTAQ